MNHNLVLNDWPQRFRRVNPLLLTSTLIVSAVFAYWVYAASITAVSLSPQSELMLEAGLKSGTFGLSGTGPWPPGYAVLLFIANTIQLPLYLVNLLLFYGSLILFTGLALYCLPELHPGWPLVLYVVSAFNYYNLAQFTAEALVLPLSMLVFWGLLAYIQKPTFFTLLWPALFCALLFLSRYHALLWLCPIIMLHIAVGKRSWLTKFRHLVGFGAIAIGPVALFMLTKFLRTGYLTGMPRFSYDSRQLSGEASYFPEQTTFVKNILLTIKTYIIDFLSPTQYATHRVNRLYELSTLELTLFLLFLLATGVVILTITRQPGCFERTPAFPQIRNYDRNKLPVMLLLEFFVAYIGITIAVWTVSNNDPIYSRFLFPSYPYFILACFAGYAVVKQQRSSVPTRWLFHLLYGVVITINLYKISSELFGWLVHTG